MTTFIAVDQGAVASAPSGSRTIVLPQRFDVHEVARFESTIARMVSAGPVVVIDASEVRYLDRHAMDCLIEARLRCMDYGCELTLATPSVAARIILELSGRFDALNPTEAAVRQDATTVIEVAA